MSDLYTKAFLAGLFFGIWPLLMNRSGLNGRVSPVVFGAIVFSICSFFAIGKIGDVSKVNWYMALGAGVVGAVGVMLFNEMLARATPQNVSSLFVVAILVQIIAPAAYQIIVSGSVSLSKVLGFVFAAVSAVLLLKQ